MRKDEITSRSRISRRVHLISFHFYRQFSSFRPSIYPISTQIRPYLDQVQEHFAFLWPFASSESTLIVYVQWLNTSTFQDAFSNKRRFQWHEWQFGACSRHDSAWSEQRNFHGEFPNTGTLNNYTLSRMKFSNTSPGRHRLCPLPLPPRTALLTYVLLPP